MESLLPILVKYNIMYPFVIVTVSKMEARSLKREDGGLSRSAMQEAGSGKLLKTYNQKLFKELSWQATALDAYFR
jgi:hypothetical protein